MLICTMRILSVLLFALPLPAFAQGTEMSQAELYPPMPGVEYYCTDASGARREIGDVICISASCTTWVARCEVSLNNPTWRKLSDGCPGVALEPADNTLGPKARIQALLAG